MRRTAAQFLVIFLFLMLGTSQTIYANPTCPPNSVHLLDLSPPGLIAGARTINGTVPCVKECANWVIFAFEGQGQGGTLLGYSVVHSDGTFSIPLNRPIIEGETVTIYADCYSDISIWQGFDVAPPIIPEPTTLLLVGSGLVALGAGVLRDARKRNPPRSTSFHSIDTH